MAKSKSQDNKEDTKKGVSTGSTSFSGSKYSNDNKDTQLLYGREFYIWMLIGVACIVLGFFLMAGGNQAPNEWNADEIYSFRRTTLAPIVILIGLGIEIYAIFKK